MELFEAIRTLRAVREYTDEPVSDEAIRTILDLAVCAPSGGNRQPWEFIVVRDPETRRVIGDHYLEVFRVSGTVTFMAYAMALPQFSIWYKRNWGTTIRSMTDGLLYSLLTGGTFGWLWP